MKRSWRYKGLITITVSYRKRAACQEEHYPELLVILDTCLCEYTDPHAAIDPVTGVDNDASLPLLVQTAVSQAKAGADIIAPSNMMDGFVTEIRQGTGRWATRIFQLWATALSIRLSSTVRSEDAAESTPSFGDRRTYQMDPANRLEALRELDSDILEGASMIVGKPALSYLDIIRDVRNINCKSADRCL